MNNCVKLGVGIFGLLLASCSETSNKNSEPSKTLSEQLGELTPTEKVNFEDLKGNTNTEKLLYLIDMPNSVKAASLIILDTQIKSFETTGDFKNANNLRENRDLLIQAADDKMDNYIAEVSKIYDAYFSTEEIDYLVKVYSEPAMQKMIDSQVELQQKAIPVAEAWGAAVGLHYGELLKAKAKKDK